MPYLDPYSLPFTAKEARHLLKRTSFGVTQTLVENAVALGLTATIDKLFEEKPLPDPPLKYKLDGTNSNNGEINDPGANYGETWVHAPAYVDLPTGPERNKVYRSRNRSSYAWSFLQMQDSEMSIREKLTLFWHNHFVAVNTNPHREYFYMHLLRDNSLKNFKELVKKVTIDTNMLLYLSGNQNTNVAPNENYSRELLELFTIGKGIAVGNEDYTNYTETDVVEIAKVLTGWKVKGLNNTDALTSYFKNNKHTLGDKILSHRFNSAIISENGENEYIDVIDTIFKQEECSNFITRKLYKWFVNSEITSEIETHIILPLATIIRAHNYDISPALKILLASEHFFEHTFCMIKSPIDLIFSATKALLLTAPKTSVKEEYEFAYILYLIATDLEQSIYHHPDVAGWKAYYQEPLFYKTWINNYLLPKRLDYCSILVSGGDLMIDSKKYTVPPLVPVLLVTAGISGAENPNTLITALTNQLFNYEISQSQLDALKEILIPGLPDFEWTIEYSNYLNTPSDSALKMSIENKLRALIGTLVQMSEFQIM
jgi:uncharacterized protein (DUF1800 family)